MKPILLAAVLLSASPALALVFDNGNGTLDWNDPVNWENDTIPGTVGGEDAVIGRVGSSGGVPFANDVNVEMNSSPVATNPIGSLLIGNGPGGNGSLSQRAADLVTSPGASSFVGGGGTPGDPARGSYTLTQGATFTQTDAEFHVGGAGGGSGSLSMAFATFNGDSVFVGSGDGGDGLVSLIQSTLNANSGLTIGQDVGSNATFSLNFGSELNVLGDGIAVGGVGRGRLDLLSSFFGSSINTTNLRVGRFGPFNPGFGSLSIRGSNHTIRATQLSVGADDGTLTGGFGTVSFRADDATPGELSPIVVSGDVTLNDGLGPSGGRANLGIGNLFSNDETLLIEVGGALTGGFFGLPEGAVLLTGNDGEPGVVRVISYAGGDGNDIVLLPFLPGDANDDGRVDGDDLIAVQTNFGNEINTQAPALVLGDADRDGVVDGDDLIAVQTNFGATLAAAVPEPAAAALVVALLVGVAGLRAR